MGTAWIAADVLDSRAGARRIEPGEVEREAERIRRALARVRTDLLEAARRVSEQLDPALAEIFGAHQMMLDGLLAAHEFERELQESLVGAPDAVRTVFGRWEARFAGLEVESFRQRADDVLDLARRVLQQLEGAGAPALGALPRGGVLVVRKLLPSDVVALSRSEVAAILVESLGPASHAALLAREKDIPVVAGLPGLFERIRRGDEVLVDASRGVVVVSPDAGTRREFEERLARSRARLSRCRAECHQPR